MVACSCTNSRICSSVTSDMKRGVDEGWRLTPSLLAPRARGGGLASEGGA